MVPDSARQCPNISLKTCRNMVENVIKVLIFLRKSQTLSENQVVTTSEIANICFNTYYRQ